MDTTEETPAPCGRKADWFLINEVLDGGEDFVAICQDCYKRKWQKALGPAKLDDVVDADVFTKFIGREPMCGDDDNSSALWAAIDETTRNLKGEPIDDRRFEHWLRRNDLRGAVQRIVIHRRFQTIENSVSRMASLLVVPIFVLLLEKYSKWMALTFGISDKWAPIVLGMVLLPFLAVGHFWIVKGRFRNFLKFKTEI